MPVQPSSSRPTRQNPAIQSSMLDVHTPVRSTIDNMSSGLPGTATMLSSAGTFGSSSTASSPLFTGSQHSSTSRQTATRIPTSRGPGSSYPPPPLQPSGPPNLPSRNSPDMIFLSPAQRPSNYYYDVDRQFRAYTGVNRASFALGAAVNASEVSPYRQGLTPPIARAGSQVTPHSGTVAIDPASRNRSGLQPFSKQPAFNYRGDPSHVQKSEISDVNYRAVDPRWSSRHRLGVQERQSAYYEEDANPLTSEPISESDIQQQALRLQDQRRRRQEQLRRRWETVNAKEAIAKGVPAQAQQSSGRTYNPGSRKSYTM